MCIHAHVMIAACREMVRKGVVPCILFVFATLLAVLAILPSFIFQVSRIFFCALFLGRYLFRSLQRALTVAWFLANDICSIIENILENANTIFNQADAFAANFLGDAA